MLLYLLTIFIVLVSALVGFLVWREKNWPSSFVIPPGDPYYNNALQFKNSGDSVYVAIDFFKKYGKTLRLKIGPVTALAITTDVKLIEMLLSSNNLLAKANFYDYVTPWLKSGIFTSVGDEWKKQRKMLTPAFHFEMLKNFVQVFERIGDEFVSKLKKHSDGETVNLKPYISLFTLDVICDSSMGTVVKDKQKKIDYLNAVKRMCELALERCFNLMWAVWIPFIFTEQYQELKRIIKTLHTFTSDVVDEKVKEMDIDSMEKLAGTKKNFLDLLLFNFFNYKNITYEKLKQEVDTFMFGGHDTTSSCIQFALYCLTQNPEVQDKILLEQKEIFGDEKNPVVTHSDIQNMKYLDLVVREVLRLYPSVPMFGRRVTEDTKYEDGVLPKFASIYVYPLFLHRNPEYFPEPEKFIPERFLNPNWPPFAYIPFSAGPKNCLGQKYAMFEVKSILAKLVRNFEFGSAENPEDFESKLCCEVVLVQKSGIKVVLKQR